MTRKKTQSVFIREEERIINGQVVMVAIYGDLDTKPEISSGVYLEELVGCSSLRTKEIAALAEQYKHDCITAALFEDVYVPPEVTSAFLETEDDIHEAESALDDEEYLPLDKQLAKMGFE